MLFGSPEASSAAKSSTLSSIPWAVMFGPRLLWQGRQGAWGNEVTPRSAVESGSWKRTVALPPLDYSGLGHPSVLQKWKLWHWWDKTIFDPWPCSHVPLIRMDLNEFTSSTGLKSFGSVPHPFACPHPYIPPHLTACCFRVPLFFFLFNMVLDARLWCFFNWFLATSYKLFGNIQNWMLGTPL